MNLLASLRAKTVFWIAISGLAGVLTGGIWISDQAAWLRHLARAETTGQLLYSTLVYNAPAPADVQVVHIGRPPETNHKLSQISIIGHEASPISGPRLQLEIQDPHLRYAIGALPPVSGPAKQLGAITRQIARLCGDPRLFARVPSEGWVELRAPDVWSCEAAPTDKRLPLALIFVLLLSTVISRATEVSGRFGKLARVFSENGTAGKAPLPVEGPSELTEIAEALNQHIASERETLEKRAEALSAISHDLGTPAARLKLRTALIDDPDLRGRMEGDIDQMIAMVEGVLSFTRTELDAEPAQRMALSSLVEALVDDYADLGRPVTMAPVQLLMPESHHSLFGVTPRARRNPGAQPQVPDANLRVLISGRPMALERAITNLIENALHYGRRATVRLEAHSETVSILVEDAGGSGMTPDDMAALTRPFRRGQNVGPTRGHGLGLSIVRTVARQHGGDLTFEQGSSGLIARLDLKRDS